ncbi:(p)ppGpp synthetase [Reticulibacter mediterranei]|uniref:(P)ppGpp synthetase n=1 Tax=Reticulibacter mediterranei TaxID=2778369 RepID=A0A8J3IKB9_9CHLR|nr:bifunctional (p)ppGpp synthetase/guanosine-3',5'-bis(diphosphate) 3'-pyrophosphohydrolase [Reticulibacter mediterranei]GHO92862.1 (p)ppGpp synthetase [Reticulibacter mediterranei]
MTTPDVELVRRALHLCLETCRDVSGLRPIPPLEHALAVATILAQMHIDAIGVSSGLVFEALDANLLSLEQIEEVLGYTTARVVGSMERLNILERKKQNIADTGGSIPAISIDKKPRIREALRRQQSETVRKMFVAMAEDPRVVLLKLAYRLHAMRRMCHPRYIGDRQEMLTMAQETREIYAPLAGRLGISRVESELEDLAFQILEPECCEWVRNLIEMESKQWRSYVERVCSILRKEMNALGVKAEVSGRVKHLYSFYKKLARNAGDVGGGGDLEALKQAADIGQIHDLIAFRILVDSTPDCYIALGHVHSLWRPKEGRIKDFIANPKPNGYQALHTTVFCLDDQLVEIQIRTHAMHEMAEYGVAMHWYYKDVGDNASASARELQTWLRQLTEWQHEIRTSNTSDTDFVEAIKDDLFEEQIFVFTPKGDVKDLPVGSTPLDFAYRIHSKVGDSCAGARIITQLGSGDGDRLVTRMVPLDYELKSGEIVDILTSRSAHPTRDWLNFARTAAARNKIRRYLKFHERDINIQIGRERLDRELKSSGRGFEAINEDVERWLCGDGNEFHVNTFEDLLAAIGSDDVRPRAVVVKLNEYWQQREGKDTREEEAARIPLSTTAKIPTVAQLQVAGVNGLLTRLANCCCPLPGDEIVGYVSRGKGVIVHRTDCQNIALYRKQDRERLINVSWTGMSQSSYLAPIVITARDRQGLLRDIAAVTSELGINVVSVNTPFRSGEQAVIAATLEISDLGQLQRALARIERIKDVFQVKRDLGKRK